MEEWVGLLSSHGEIKLVDLWVSYFAHRNRIQVRHLNFLCGSRYKGVDMAAHINDDEPQDIREMIWLEYDKFVPDNHKVSAFITSKFTLQTCVEGASWKNVTSEQRNWYWDEFVKKYKCDKKYDSELDEFDTGQTIHRWRQKRKHPETIIEAQWAKWTDVWDNEDWKATASKYKENKNAETVGPGTSTTKHITGSKCYAMHVLRKQLKREPTSWEIFVHTHRRADDTFVDECSRQLHEQMEAYL